MLKKMKGILQTIWAMIVFFVPPLLALVWLMRCLPGTNSEIKKRFRRFAIFGVIAMVFFAIGFFMNSSLSILILIPAGALYLLCQMETFDLAMKSKDEVMALKNKTACTCPKKCNCQNPPPDDWNGKNGAFLVSEECPVHNTYPNPAWDCPIHGTVVPKP